MQAQEEDFNIHLKTFFDVARRVILICVFVSCVYTDETDMVA